MGLAFIKRRRLYKIWTTASFVLLAALLVCPTVLPLAVAQRGGPLPPQQAVATLQVADGFQAELFAAEPMLMNPTSIDVDHRGRVWVAEAVNYRRVGFNRPLLRAEGDRIVVLVDETGAGRATRAVTFYQGKDLIAPLSVLVLPQPNGQGLRVLVAQSPDILEFWDRDGDLQADGPPRKFLSGFGGFDHDHGVHGLTVGPDGKLYFTVGDSGVKGLQSADGRGRKWTSNATDCRAGTVWRCNLDGTELERIAHNFRNNYEACVDSFGELWLSDNDDDGNQQTRICFVMPGGNYGYHPRGPGESHWHEEHPGIVHKVLRTGFGSPTGITFYEGNLFGPKYVGALLHCDAGPREVRWFFRKPQGAGYELDKQVLLTSSDNWFRPSDVCVAPDGSIFVADWYDRGVGGHGMGDPFDGRIYRITPKGHKGYTVPQLKLDSHEGLLAALASPNLATRQLAIHTLQAMKEPDRDCWIGETLVKVEPPHVAARILWQSGYTTPDGFARLPEDARKRVEQTLERLERNLHFRASLPRHYQSKERHEVESFLKWYVPSRARQTPPDLPCCREAALLLPKLPPEDVRPHFYALAKLYDGSDHFYRAALNIACGTDPARREAILADFDKHFPQWNDKVADLVWELRPPAMLPRLGTLLADPRLTAAQKGRLLEIIAVYDTPAAGQTVLDVLRGPSQRDVKQRAIGLLRTFLPTKWRGLGGSPALREAIDALVRDESSADLAMELIAAARATERIDWVVQRAVDPTAPAAVRRTAIRTLGQLPDRRSVDALARLLRQSNPLAAEAVAALGELLPRQPKPPPYATAALQTLQELLLDSSRPLELRGAVVATFAANRVATIWLLELHQQGRLPAELRADVGRWLRNSPFQDLRNRALLAFPPPSQLNRQHLPPIAELVRRTGDPARGRAVWDASANNAAQCAKCHMVHGRGGQVGPDLSMIGKKASRENLFESILYPSRAIADQFVQYQVTTTAEVTLTGLIIADTAEAIVLRDANGKDFRIVKADLAAPPRKLPTSLMPEDVVAALTEDDLIDLVAYLETLKRPALTPQKLYLAGPFAGRSMTDALERPFGPENSPFRSGDAFGEVRWRLLPANADGYFDLAAAHGLRAAPSASYLYMEFESPTEQTADVLLGSDDGARLWLNGQQVFKTRATRAAAPQQERIAVRLRKGKNTLLLKVANGDGPHGAYLTLLSDEELKILLP